MVPAEPPGVRRLRTGARVDGDRPPRQPPTFGPEPAIEIAGRVWCWWDLWIAAVVVLDHDGEFGALTDATVVKIGALHDGRRAERLYRRWHRVETVVAELGPRSHTRLPYRSPHQRVNRTGVRVGRFGVG